MYAFAEHKGYGTEKHLAALAQHGPCALHRRSFAPIKPNVPAVAELFKTEEQTVGRVSV
jgi:ribonuclease HII